MKLKTHRLTAKKTVARLKSRVSIRKKLEGSTERPRLAVFRSNKNIYAQVIDDQKGQTLVSVSSLKESQSNSKPLARLIGQRVAQKALEKNISSVKFDRSGYLYHGRIQMLADAAREAGLKF